MVPLVKMIIQAKGLSEVTLVLARNAGQTARKSAQMLTRALGLAKTRITFTYFGAALALIQIAITGVAAETDQNQSPSRTSAWRNLNSN